MLLLLCVNVAYVLVIGCEVAASKYCHHCGINTAVTVCSSAPKVLLKGNVALACHYYPRDSNAHISCLNKISTCVHTNSAKVEE